MAVRFDQLAPDLQAWFRDMLARRSPRDQIVQALLTAGYDPAFALNATTAAFAAAPAADSGPAQAASQQVTTPKDSAAGAVVEKAVAAPDSEFRTLSERLATIPNTLDLADRNVEMLFALADPRVVLFGNLLSDDECDELVTMSRGKLERSSVVNAETGAYDVHPHRTSLGTYFQRGENPLIRRIEQRIAELVQYPVDRGEPLQILYYQPGGEYKPHHDYFDPALPGNETVLAQGGQRIATLIMYLSDVQAGGSTVFPQIGLDVLPRKGHAVYFAYCSETGALDPRSLHGGSPVAEGEKWIATKWFRQTEYVGPGI